MVSFKSRFIIYLFGIFALAIGSNLFLNAALGVAPSCSLALTLTFLLPCSYAFFNFVINTVFLIFEAMLAHQFGKTQIVQLLITFIYSYLIKCTGLFLNSIHPTTLVPQILLACIACAVMAFGITLTLQSNITVMPYEGFIGALSIRTKVEFGKLRVISDILFTLISILISLIVLHQIQSVGLGTILAAFLTGNIVTLYTNLLTKKHHHPVLLTKQFNQ